jgi:hypothetical protein
MSNPVGPEFNGPGAGVRSYLTPRTSPYNWSSSVPTTQGWYFVRRPHPKGTGWEVRVAKVFQRDTGSPLQAVWQNDAVHLLTDAFWKVAQWSFQDIPEPLG